MSFRTSRALFIISIVSTFSFLLGAFFTAPVFASQTNGSIDPGNQGYAFIDFVDAPDVGVHAATSRINAGKFTAQPLANISITDAGLAGYFWGASSGWIVTNCSTINNCSVGNDNFKVAVANDGTLSGFAWGENTGWINFGPFTLASVPQVKIDADGFFRGTNSSTSGYAWSENFGWMVFDCATTTNCVQTDYVPALYRVPEKEDKRSGVVGVSTQCSNGVDDDGDGLIDGLDPECAGGGSSEFLYTPVFVPSVVEPVVPTTPVVPPSTGMPPTTPVRPTKPVPLPPREDGLPITTENPAREIIPTITQTVTDIVTGNSSVPEARDRVIEIFTLIVAALKNFFAYLVKGVADVMNTVAAQRLVLQIAALLLAVVVFFAVLAATVTPVITASQLRLLPQLFWQNILAVFTGAQTQSWGVVYDAHTYTPLALTKITISTTTGSVVETVVTASDGSFTAAVADGLYTITIPGHQIVPGGEGVTPVVYNTFYSRDISIVDGQPLQSFDIAVKGDLSVKTTVTGVKEFLLYHEVALTNWSLGLFGVGMFAALLYLIFVPSMLGLIVFLSYCVVALLRAVGMFGSYASVFLEKGTEQPLSGALITVYDKFTHAPVAKTLTSRFGRAYLSLPDGYFYTVVDSSPSAPGGLSTIATPFATHAGLYRKRFLI